MKKAIFILLVSSLLGGCIISGHKDQSWHPAKPNKKHKAGHNYKPHKL